MRPRVLSQCHHRTPHTFCPYQFSPSQPHQLRVRHTLRSAIVVRCASRHEDEPESVLQVSIAHLSRPSLRDVTTSGHRSSPLVRRMKLPNSVLHFLILKCFSFSFFIFLKKKVSSFLFSCISFKYVSLLAFVSEFNCFLRSRCSMEVWCPDDMGRDSWDWVGPPAWEESMLPLPRVGWKLLAC